MPDPKLKQRFDSAYDELQSQIEDEATVLREVEDALSDILDERRVVNGVRQGVEEARKSVDEARRALENTVREHLARSEGHPEIEENTNPDLEVAS